MTNHTDTTNPLQLDDLLPRLSRNRFGRSVKSVIEKALGLSYLARGYDELDTRGKPENFVKQAFNKLDINLQLVSGSLDHIPETGPTIVVANHPYGAIDGMAMIDLLMQRRSDIKVMANGFLKRVPEIRDVILGVNPYGHAKAKQQNVIAMRECLRWLEQGGLIFMFPAGDVSSIKISELAIRDNDWDTKVARLAIKTSASIVPVHIDGRNSASFYLAGAVHPHLKTLLLPRQIINKRGSNIKIRIGKAITVKKLSRLNSEQEMVELIKSRTYVLAAKSAHQHQPENLQQAITAPIFKELLVAEINTLPEKQCMVDNGELQVYYTRASQTPWIMQEIGRLREISFREVGEGSGKAIDIDHYDDYYLQLFIWNKTKQEIVGAYRLGLTDEINRQYGLAGLYSYSLFRLDKSFLDKMPPAIELGRSFVRPEYQRSFTPLLLLWKGIAQFVYQQPAYCVLFGPVSISNDYSSVSQQLLIKFLKLNLFDSTLGRLVKPRNPYKNKHRNPLTFSNIHNMSVDELSNLISSFEEDDKGVPILIRQYLKLGGQMLGFNIDHQFGDCIDGLIRVDLRQADEKVLAKYMGKTQTQEYFDYHRLEYQKAG